ncbi:MAG: polymer-forming cytoskeletal protein [Burkholderiales bacterium]|nr:polymer-forming cytoskeletal protein [Burkholderiales bacterium]
MFNKRKPRPAIEGTRLSSLVAEDVEIVGDLCFAGGVRVDGCVRGRVVGRAAEGQAPALLVLSAKGRIEGDVVCGDAVINGTVIGDLAVEHFLELQAGARVSGTIRYRQLQLDVGATVQGLLQRAEDAAPAGDNVIALAAEAARALPER